MSVDLVGVRTTPPVDDPVFGFMRAPIVFAVGLLGHVERPALVYQAKDALHRFYRTRGFDRATYAFRSLVDSLAPSNLPELHGLRRTLLRWRREVLA